MTRHIRSIDSVPLHGGCRHCAQVDGRTQALLDHRLRLAQLPAADAAAALLLRGLMELCIYPPQPLSSTTSHAGARSGGGVSSWDSGSSAQGAGDLASDPAAERVAEAAAAAGSTSYTADSLPVSWSCTDEAVLQVHHLLSSSTSWYCYQGHWRQCVVHSAPDYLPPATVPATTEATIVYATSAVGLKVRCSLQILARRSPAKRGLPMLGVRLLRRLLHWNPTSRPSAASALRHAYFTVDLSMQQTYRCPGGMASGNDAEVMEGWC